MNPLLRVVYQAARQSEVMSQGWMMGYIHTCLSKAARSWHVSREMSSREITPTRDVLKVSSHALQRCKYSWWHSQKVWQTPAPLCLSWRWIGLAQFGESSILAIWIKLTSNILYKTHPIAKFKCFSFRLAVVFAKSSEARCYVENEDLVGAAPTGDAPTTSEWSTILLPTKVRLILETLRYAN